MMNKTLITCSVISLLVVAACKKKDNSPSLPTTMTVVVNKDTAWTSTNVTTDNKNTGTVYITGKSPDGNSSMELTISGYDGTKKTYTIDYRGPGGNIYGNLAQYKDDTSFVVSRSGRIVITGVTQTMISGTFKMYYLQTEINGSFEAPVK